MKKIKTPFLLLLVAISLVLSTGCQNDDDSEVFFGDRQTGFEAENIYKAKTNGFLDVKFDTNFFDSEHKVIVYSDNNVNPTSEIGFLITSGTLFLPIKKGDTWKVSVNAPGTINITFIPILN